MKKVSFRHHKQIYCPNDIDRVLSIAVNEKNIIGNNKGQKFYNIPCAFDIEVSSFYRDANGKTYDYKEATEIQNRYKIKLEKCSTMYVWQFGINGYIIMGREWGEFITMCEAIAQKLRLTENLKLIVYIHNLSYEFQFIRNLFTWMKVFSIDMRKPIYGVTSLYIEFRCSYLLSGYSLAMLGGQLTKYHCEKLIGELDYTLLRHSRTQLTPKEIAYCVNDVMVVMSYVQERIEEYKGLTRLPITKTGFVRKYCRKHCLRTVNENKKTINNYKYRDIIQNLTIGGLGEFNCLQRAFAGGFTHANGIYVDEVLNDVDGYDFTSSYPYVMVSEQYPMSSGVKIECKSFNQFNYLITKYCCIFDIEFTDLFAKLTNDNPLSVSKCVVKEHVAENNGRVVCAKRIVTTLTEVDYNIISKYYTWGNMRVGTMYCYKKGYLPTDFIKSILHLYEKKTQLKGVQGKETEYLNSKEMLNSCYGMCVTNPLRDEFTYNGEWDTTKMSKEQQEELLFKYNTSKNRFLFYPWGVYITAYARRNLFTGIFECGNDYVYSDTDSIKLLNGEKHKKYFEAYNMLVEQKLKKACKYHGISFELCKPKTIKGKENLLGVWDYEGCYKRFKTLGAKRYMVESDSALTVDNVTYDYSLTVSGVNKQTAIPYLLEKYGEKGIFDAFTNYLHIPENATGKNIHTYIDYPIRGTLTDYNGTECDFEEQSAVHLEPTSYCLSLAVMYINYLRGIKFHD